MRRGVALALLLALAAIPGCKSAESYRTEADRDVLRLVEDRRAKLSLDERTFTIEPDPASLRQRILRGETSSTGPLSLVQCLEIAAENSRQYQDQKEELYLSALDLTLERWRFGVITNGAIATAIEGTGSEGDTASGSAGFGFSKLLGTGASILGDIGLNLARTLTFSDGWHPVSDFGGSITQPLLRGFGRSIVEEPLTQAERDLVYAVRSFERFRRTFAVDAATRYYAILEAKDAMTNQERNVESLTQLTLRNRALADAGRLSDIDVGQARQDELSSRNNLLTAQERLQRDIDSFKLFLGLPIPTELELEPGALAELSREELAELHLAEGEATAFALANRLDYLNTQDRRADSQRRVDVAADNLRAGLSLRAEARATSLDGKPLEYNFQDTTWALTATLDLPLDRLPERNAYRAALIAREASTRSAEQLGDTIQADLREELRQLQTRRESYSIQQNAVELAQKRIESTRLKLEAGRADTRSLLEAERSLLQAQNSATTALIDYTLARLALFRDMELLRVDSAGIRMEEGLLSGAGEGPKP